MVSSLLTEHQSLSHAQRLPSCSVKARVCSEPWIISQHGQPMLFRLSRSSSPKPSPSIPLDARVCSVKVVASGQLFKQSSETAGSSGAHERQKARPHSHSSRTNSCFQRDSLGVASPGIIIHLSGSSDLVTSTACWGGPSYSLLSTYCVPESTAGLLHAWIPFGSHSILWTWTLHACLRKEHWGAHM